ncbi:MAG TPA: hypothetical protein VH593_24380, partial [Ktedonobacteraceae bacterium]
MTQDKMYEQKAYFSPVSEYRHMRAGALTRHYVSTTDDVVLPEDENDAIYDMRLPNSIRRYHAPTRTEVHITRHQGVPPRRASQKQPQAPHPQVHPRRRRSPLLYVGLGMLAMAFLFTIVEIGSSIGHRMYNDAHYGYPRTYQCDADVKHGGMSHFVVENLHGHVVIIEILVNNLSKTMIY